MPAPAPSPLTSYLAHLERDQLAYQWSPQAGRAVFYPRVLCPFSGSDQLEWRVSKGLGTVYSTTVVHPQDGAPYNVALIDGEPHDERPHLVPPPDLGPHGVGDGAGPLPAQALQHVTGAAAQTTDEVRIGMRVRFRAHRPGGEAAPIPVFFPLEA